MKTVWGWMTSTFFIALVLGYVLAMVVPGPGAWAKSKVGM
jgi:hypothetical protein